MPSVTVTESPQSLAALLGVEDGRLPGDTTTAIWSGIAQNTSSTKTIYRLRSATQPDRVAPAFRHRPGEQFRLAIWSGVATWVWVASGSACLVTEEVSSIDHV